MADGSITIEIKSDSGDLEKDLRNIKQEAKEVERALSMDGGGLDKASRAADELDDALDDAAQAADRLGDEVEGSSGGVSKLSGGFSVLKGAAAGVVAELAGRAIDAFVDLGSEAINAADSLTKFESTMSFAGFSTAEIDAARDAVQNYASQTVYDLGEVANTTAQLAANGVQDYQKLTEAAGNLNAVAGGSADTFGSVAMVLTQTAGAGKLTTENWNQLADAIPGASGVIQNELKAMGAYTGEFRDAMAKGEISAEEFNQAIMNLGFSEAAVEASSSVSTIEGAVGNLRATIVDGFVAVLTDGGLMEGITGFINGIATILTNAGQYIGPAIQSIKDSITGIGDAFRNAFGEERSAAILNFLSQLASAMIAVPFQVVAAAVEVVATAFELLIGVVGGVVDFFTGSLPNAFNAISTAIGAITPSLGDFGNYFRREFESMNTNASKSFENLKNNASKSWENLKSKVTESAENLNTNASKSFEQLRSAVSEKTESAKQKATEAFERLKSDVTSKVDQAKQAVTTAFQNIVSAISSALNNALSQAKSILSNILSALTSWGSNMLSSAKSAISNVVNGIGTWTRSELNSVRLKTSIESTKANNRSIRIYGADLTVTYTYQSQKFMLKTGGAWADVARVFKKVSGIWVEQTDLSSVIPGNVRYQNGGEYVPPVKTVTITGQGWINSGNTFLGVVINGVTYTKPATVEVDAGTVIQVLSVGEVYLNGSVVVEGGEYIYSHTVNENCTINLEINFNTNSAKATITTE